MYLKFVKKSLHFVLSFLIIKLNFSVLIFQKPLAPNGTCQGF